MKDKILEKVQVEMTVYPEWFKRKVCEEHLKKGIPKDHLMAKYGIKGKSAILNWLRKFGYIETFKTEPIYEPTFLTEMGQKKQEGTQDQEALQAKVKALEKALEQAQLEKEAWRMMVEVAERELKIDIRKKSGTKQSKK